MRLFVIALVLAVTRLGSAAPVDPYERASFSRVAKGEVNEVVFLGFSPGGKKLAYVRAEVLDGSGFLVIDAVELEPSTGKELDRYRFHGQAAPDEPLVMKQKKPYEAFLARMKAEGISREHAKAWTREGARFVGPDGKLVLRWRVGRERGDAESETASGRVYAAALEDELTSDHAVLFELFAGRGADGVARKDPPKFTEVWSSSDGDGLVVLAHAEGRVMCWNDDTIDVQAYSLGKLRVGRPARDLNNPAWRRIARASCVTRRPRFAWRLRSIRRRSARATTSPLCRPSSATTPRR